MAIDDWLGRGGGFNGAPLLRLYRWSSPTLSCGFHQRIRTRVDLASCSRLGVNVVRRPTGGRELLHDGDLSFSVAYPIAGRQGSLKEILVSVGEMLRQTLWQTLRVKTQIVDRKSQSSFLRGGPCLAAAATYEITWQGKKVVPMAQRVYPHRVLVHGSIPLVRSSILTADLLLLPDREAVQRHVDAMAADLRSITGRSVALSELKEGLVAAFESRFGGKVCIQPLEESELEAALVSENRWRIEALQEDQVGKGGDSTSEQITHGDTIASILRRND